MNATSPASASLVDSPLSQLIAERPERVRVFENFGIDYCCHGKRPLREACIAASVPLETVLAALRDADALRSTSAEPDWAAASLEALIDHIIQTHHAWLRVELPRLGTMMDKIREDQSAAHPEFIEMREVFANMAIELENHMNRQEQNFFPLIKTLESGSRPARLSEGALNEPIHEMELEHEEAGEALRRLRELSDGYRAPAGASETQRLLDAGLAELEANMRGHMHKENNILFPRAAKLHGTAPAPEDASR
jgi:regulator of cell morphogenesis and NO signaling